MGKKYIIEIADDRNIIRNCGKTTLAVSMAIGKTAGSINTGIELTPYTEPDLEQVRKEAYEKGFDAGRMLNKGKYEKGLNDAWDAARKIWQSDSYLRIFKVPMRMDCFTKFSASEAIEKLKQYEQKQEEELGIHGYFKNGEELIDADGTKAVILRVSKDNYCQVYTENGCIENWHIHTYKFHKTGRTFPEIAAVIEKMKEGQEQ